MISTVKTPPRPLPFGGRITRGGGWLPVDQCTRVGTGVAPGLIIIGAQLHANPVYLGPALTFALVDFILPLALAVEIGHRARAPELARHPADSTPPPSSH
jgi:hypothetical protein